MVDNFEKSRYVREELERRRVNGDLAMADGVDYECEVECEVRVALSTALEELEKLRDRGASAKELAAPLRYVSVLKMAQALSGEDMKLAMDAATKILDRSDGKVDSGVGNNVEVNVVTGVIDDRVREDLANRLSFIDELKSRRLCSPVIDVAVEDISVDIEDIN